MHLILLLILAFHLFLFLLLHLHYPDHYHYRFHYHCHYHFLVHQFYHLHHLVIFSYSYLFFWPNFFLSHIFSWKILWLILKCIQLEACIKHQYRKMYKIIYIFDFHHHLYNHIFLIAPYKFLILYYPILFDLLNWYDSLLRFYTYPKDFDCNLIFLNHTKGLFFCYNLVNFFPIRKVWIDLY